MGIKTTVKLDSAALKKFIEAKQKLIKDNIVAVLRKEAVPSLIDKIMKGFDKLSERADQLPEDPTNPSNWRQEFLDKLQKDFQENFIIQDNRLIIRVGEKKFLGYDPSGLAPPGEQDLVWLVYYIEGLAGEWGFLTPDIYDSLRGQGAFQSTWGRFGKGFLISKEQFDSEGWQTVTSFEAIKHPFSGFSPVDIFQEALDEFNLRPFIKKAIKAASENKKL